MGITLFDISKDEIMSLPTPNISIYFLQYILILQTWVSLGQLPFTFALDIRFYDTHINTNQYESFMARHQVALCVYKK